MLQKTDRERERGREREREKEAKWGRRPFMEGELALFLRMSRPLRRPVLYNVQQREDYVFG